MYQMSNVNLAWNYFETSMNKLLEEVAPTVKVITSPQQLAQEQMDYFTKNNRKLLDDIQDPPDIDPLETL